MNQKIYLGSLDFTVLRILVFVGMLRVVFRGEDETIQWNGFDKLVLIWNISSTLIYTIQLGTMAAFLNRCGVMYDSLGTYWLCRNYFRSFDDITSTVKLFAICAVITTPFVAAEKYLQLSPFSVFGPTGGQFHRGRFRCAGPFPHYIMLGCFWASILPLFYASFKVKINHGLNQLGMVCGTGLVLLSASSTPLLSVVAMCLFWMCYKYREIGGNICFGICTVLTLLHIVMQKPVWHLMARVNVFGGSTGWHRYYLFDNFINHISEWFFLGVSSTYHWGIGMGDITNQYVLEGVRGGAITLFIFIFMLYKAIKISGRCSIVLFDHPEHWIAWGVCISLLTHSFSFWGVSYFGQILMLFYMTLAMVGFLSDVNRASDEHEAPTAT